MSDKDRGLYHKYYVQKIVDCDLLEIDDWVFVLNPKTDPLAARALVTYAHAADLEGYEALAEDIYAKLDELDAWPST